MRRFRFYFLLLLTLLLKSCEVPDVQPFTQATTDMAAAIKASLKQVTDDFAQVDAVNLDTGQRASLVRSQDSLAQIVKGFGTVTLAFDRYAQALNKVVDDHKSRAETAKNVSKAVADLATATAVLGPIPAVAKVLAVPVGKLATDISAVRALNGLNQLVSPLQDTLIQHTTQVLKLCLLQFARIDRRLYDVLEASRPVSDTNTQHYYSASQELRQAMANQLELLTKAQVYIVTQSNLGRLQASQAAILAFESQADPDGTIRSAWPRSQPAKPPTYAPLLKALTQRRAVYEQMSFLPQAQYDAVQAGLPDPEKGAALLRKSAQVLDVWARSHHDLRLLVIKARHITRQELIDHAKEVQQLVNDLKAATK